MPTNKFGQMSKMLQSAGIPPAAIAKLLAFMQTQGEMKMNPNAKLDTSQIEDMRQLHSSKKTPKPSKAPAAKEWWK